MTKVTIDTETEQMIKRRFGDDFHTQLSDKLEVKVAEVVRKNVRDGGRRKPRGDNKERGERKPRENRDRKEGDKVQAEATEPKAEQGTEEKTAPAKREGRRRGGREGQE